MSDLFNIYIPAQLEKGADGEWRVRGLASTEAKDQQQEILIQKGIDLTPIDKGQGYFNFDHQPGPENLVGTIDGYKRGKDGLYVEGRLFKNHTKAKAIYEIMSSLSKGDRGRVGLSVEGKILERDNRNPKIIKKCQIRNVAITFNPVNSDTYADLVKSLSETEIDFQASEANSTKPSTEVPTFTANQVVELIEKTLGLSNAQATVAPGQRKDGDALTQEEATDGKNKKKNTSRAKLVSNNLEMFKSHLSTLVNKIHELYPTTDKMDLWLAIKDRLERKFPELRSEHS